MGTVPSYALLTEPCKAMLQRLAIPCFVYEFDEEHKKRRLKVFTGTDMPVLMGFSPYNTPQRLIREKLEELPAFDGNDLTDAGHAMEPMLLSKALLKMKDWLEDEVEQARREGEEVVLAFQFWAEHPSLPLGATLDLAIIRRSATDYSILRIIEGKFTTSVWDEAPERIACQCWVQAMVGGTEEVEVAYFDRTGQVKFQVVDLDPAQEAAVRSTVNTYWPYLFNRTAPEVEFVTKDEPAPKINGANQRMEASEENLQDEIVLRDLIHRRKALKDQIDALKEELEDVEKQEDHIKIRMSFDLRVGVTKDCKLGILYKSQRIKGTSPDMERARLDYVAKIKINPNRTPEELDALWNECIADNTPRGEVSTSVTYKSNKEK